MGVMAAACEDKAPPPAPPPPEVLVTSIVRRDVPIPMELVGQTRGFQDVEIRARVEGFLDIVGFLEGSIVHRGQVLYRIDRKPLEASLANVTAELATAQARYEKTQNDVKRLQPLAARQAVSAQELDNALAAAEAARTQVEARRADVQRVSLDLGYTNVTSPIDGLAGTTLVKAGSLVGRGESTLLTTVSQIDPILFRAGISEAEYLRLSRRAEELRAARHGEKVPIDLVLADGSVHPHKGYLDAIERAIDATTGTLSLQFRFPNPGGLIRPGQYGRAQFVIESRQGAMLVPQQAVQQLQNQYNVVTVGSDNKVAFKTVTVGPKFENLWIVESGLTGSEQVVVAGLQRLRDGMVVRTKPAPAAAPAGAAPSAPAPAGGR
ncbi:MexE family multidrug efflux RND transporter periplasmic adaptor subunit [Luteitalea sp. TBR-22]|nr:MexE family multidrug efflux RND transporter periplasmic adaptor subunit [Luteitalea sp. TBR-22]